MLAVTSDARLESRAERSDGGRSRHARRSLRTQFIGLFAPRGTPKAIIEQIARGRAPGDVPTSELQRMFVTAGVRAGVRFQVRRTLAACSTRRLAKWTPVIKVDRIEAGLGRVLIK